jgi:hypothetical protein
MMAFWHNANYLNLLVMKTTQPQITKKWPNVTIDPALNEYRDKTLFSEKLKQANKMLKTAKLPPNKNLH